MFDHTRIRRSLVAGMAIGVAAFPAVAQAEIYRAVSSGAQPPAAVSAPAHQLGPSAQTAFNWADAGIGAGGAIVLVGAGAASAVAMRRRRLVGVA
jgi:hypothetical protein